MKRIDAPRAWAWEMSVGICSWALSSQWSHDDRDRPSPEAKLIRVRIVREADYRRMYRALKEVEDE